MSKPGAVEFADVARSLTDELGLDQAVRKVVEFATEMTEAEHGGVALLRAEAQLEVAAVTGETVERADQLQDSLHEGPAVSASRSHETCLIRDTAQDSRWPRWGPMAAHLGLHSAVSTCMYTNRRTVGTLSLYAAEADRLDEEDAERAQVLASHAAVAIDFLQEESGLRRAVETRNIIGQAQGLLMERYGLDAQRAFEVLRRYSQDTNVNT